MGTPCRPVNYSCLSPHTKIRNKTDTNNTLTHEIHHLAVAIARELGIDLESETPAYIAGDTMREFADVVCRLGCEHCRG